MKNIYLEINFYDFYALHGFNPKSILGIGPKKFNLGSAGVSPASLYSVIKFLGNLFKFKAEKILTV